MPIMQISTPDITRKFIPLAVLFAVLVLLMPRTAKFNYDYKKGTPWPYETLISQFDFPILKTEEQIQEERENAGAIVIPYYKYSDEVTTSVIKNVQGLDLGAFNSLRPAVVTRLRDIYAKGVISDGRIRSEHGAAKVSEDLIYIQRDKRAVTYPRTEVYKVSDARDQLVSLLAPTYPSVNLDSLFRRTGVYNGIIPNLVYDAAMTSLTHAESDDYISPTLGYVKAEEKIVSNGEIVTAEIAQVLDSYKAEYNKVFGYGGPRILLYLGNVLIALVLVVLLYFCIHFAKPSVFVKDDSRYYYLLFLFLLSAVITFLAERFAPSVMYLIPYPVMALYLQAFFRNRVVMPVYIMLLLPVLIFCGNGMELFVMFLTAGMVTIQTFGTLNKGWQQFINAAIIFGVELAVFMGFRLIDAGSTSIWWLQLIQIFVGAMLTVALYPLVYLFEKMFNLVSITRLIELADTNNPLLQELSAKAPGTFQHCLQVMNMVDAVGRATDANVPLLRCAALYHDLGKMQNPLCFIENETSSPGAAKYHDGKTPKESAADIIRHVDDGLALADEHHLPSVVKNFIRSHHGTSCTAYFLNKYLNDGGDPADVAEFYYHGQKPSTKEEVILMICDSIEAASRTLKEFTPEAYDHFVEGIVAGKEKAGQLEDADITLHEMNLIKSMLKTYMQQIYHGRVVYPKRKR
ncbi:MAG: HDIG domain-containing protein [Bacteroidales bacterium]|nr:HDIG domain-containing protein [Bacteroidales bacterium]